MEVDIERAPEPVAQESNRDPLLMEGLRKLVASLPEKKRLLIILRYQEEMSVEDIAKIIGIPSRTVRTRLFRTLEQLRDKATHYFGEVKL